MTPTEWLLGNDTGISSKTILSVMTGSEIKRADVPYDAGDFGRCHRLLSQFPEWKERLNEVSAKHKEWSAIVEAWDELTELYEADSGDFFNRIQALIEDGRITAGWKKTGPGSWRGPGVEEVEISPGVTMRF